MATTLSYRLRIRDASTLANPDGTLDDLIVTSVRGGTNPYIREAPHGDGQELDPLAGTVRAGVYNVTIADAITGGTSRVFTAKLFDANGRQQMLSRRAYVEISTDGGATWPTVLIAGYILGYRLVDAITWEVAVGDTRRIEQNYNAFDGTSATFPKRGCLFGGPIIGGWGPVVDRGGWLFRVKSVTPITIPGGTGNIVFYDFQQGYRGITDPLTTKLQEALGVGKDDLTNPVTDAGSPFYKPSVRDFGVRGYPGLVLRTYLASSAALLGSFTPGIPTGLVGNTPWVINHFMTPCMSALWPAGVAAPSPGDVHRIHLYAQAVTDTSPVYVTEHPVDLATKLLGDAGISYDSASAATVRSALGDTLRLSMRITQSTKLLDFLQKVLFGPFGFAARTNSAGKLELFTTRVKTAAAPGVTVNTNDLRSGDDTVFDGDEATVISTVRIRSRTYYGYDPQRDGTMQRPLDSVLEREEEVINYSPDYTTFGAKEQTYDLSGMVHDAASFTPAMSDLISATALEIFDRFGHGAPVTELKLLRSSDTGLKVGDEVYVQPAHFPNLNKRYGDDPSVGARIMQVVRRTEAPEGPELKLLDAGSAQQPVTPAATIAIAASAQNPRSVAQFTVTNAATINAAGVLTAVVQWATGGSAPAGDGTMFARYTPGACPTVAQLLPPVDPGTKVWVRARTEQDGRRPSAWTAWASVTLTAASAPTGVTISNIKQNAAQVNWTVASSTDLVDVYVAPGSVAPADWSPYLVQTLPAGSTRLMVRGLSGPTVAYIAGVAHRDPATGKLSPVATATFSTNSTLDMAGRPAGIAIISTSQQDSGFETGIAVALYPADRAVDLVIERAPDSGGSPGAYVEICVVRGSQEVYVDRLPLDNVQRWYRIRHRYSGATDSSPTCGKAGTPAALPSALQRPDPVIPVINESASITQGSVVCTMTVAVTDPQCRVDFVEKRTKVDPGAWSGWSTVAGPSPYQATVGAPTGNAPGFGWIEMRVWGYDAQGNYGVLADFTEAFDANTIPSIAMLEGSFKDDGSLLIRVTADDDTASVYCTVSTSGYPSDGTLLGTSPVNGRNVEFTFAGPYAIGTVVYVSAKACGGLGGAGALSDTFQLRIVRGNDAASKTIRLPASAVIDVFDSATQTKDLSNTYYKCAAQQGNFGFIPVPKGATLTAVRIRTWAASRSISQDLAQLYVFRVDNDGTRTQLGSTQSSTVAGAWETLAVTSLSEDTSGNRSYLVEFGCQQGVGTGTSDYRCAWIEYDISVPNFNVTT